MRRNRQLPQFVQRLWDWIWWCLYFIRIKITQCQSIMCFSSKLFWVVFLGGWVVFFFPLPSIAAMCMQQEQTYIIKILYGLYAEKYWYLYGNTVFVSTNRFIHVPYTYICAEISYIILRGGSTSKIFCTVNWKGKCWFSKCCVLYLFMGYKT